MGKEEDRRARVREAMRALRAKRKAELEAARAAGTAPPPPPPKKRGPKPKQQSTATEGDQRTLAEKNRDRQRAFHERQRLARLGISPPPPAPAPPPPAPPAVVAPPPAPPRPQPQPELQEEPAESDASLFHDAPPPSTERRRAVGKYERLFHERQARDLQQALARGLVWRPEKGDRVVQWIETYCKHHKGEWAGQKMVLEEWQRDILRVVFGWFRTNGKRRFHTAYVEVPRKNGKSQLCAGVGLYLTIGDEEPGAEVYSSATKLEQAKIVWKEAAAMVKSSKTLTRHLVIRESAPVNITAPAVHSTFVPLSADAKLDGLNPHGSIVDELHQHPNRKIWDGLMSAFGARRNYMTFAITTAGEHDETSIGWEQHTYAQKVLEGVYDDDDYFAFIAAADVGDDPFDPVTWEKANPNIDVSCKRDYLERRARTGRNQPSELNSFLTKNLNIWTAQETAWLSIETWNKSGAAPKSRLDYEKSFSGWECNAGLDLSTKKDMSALVFEFKKVVDSRVEFFLVPRFFLPEERIREYEKKGQKFYRRWVEEGLIIATPGAIIDYDFIYEQILRDSKQYKIRDIAYDVWNATYLATRLTSAGFSMVECRQGVRTLSDASKEFEASILDGRLHHNGHAVLRWNAGNVAITKDANENIRPVKPDSENSGKRIDGVMAAIMARWRTILDEKPANVRPYEARGFWKL